MNNPNNHPQVTIDLGRYNELLSMELTLKRLVSIRKVSYSERLEAEIRMSDLYFYLPKFQIAAWEEQNYKLYPAHELLGKTVTFDVGEYVEPPPQDEADEVVLDDEVAAVEGTEDGEAAREGAF